MPRLKSVIGTGITQRAVLEFDWSKPSDVKAQINAAVETFNQTRFEKIAANLISQSQQILAQAGLPSDIDAIYAITGPGKWKLVKQPRSTKRQRSESLDILQLVAALGRDPDSLEGYAVRILFTIDNARTQCRDGQIDEAMAAAFTAGTLITEAYHKETWEADALRGEKVLEGAKSAHEATHGSAEERKKNQAAFVETFNTYRNQGFSKTLAVEATAHDHGVSSKTIRRARKALAG